MLHMWHCDLAGTPCDLLVSGIVCLTTSFILLLVLYHGTSTDPGTPV